MADGTGKVLDNETASFSACLCHGACSKMAEGGASECGHASVAGIKKCDPHHKSHTTSMRINWNECGIARSTDCRNTKTL